MRHRLLCAAACLALPLAACDVNVDTRGGVSLEVSQGRASDEWKRTYTLPPGGRLEIVNTQGALTVVGTSGRQVDVVATREARAPTDEEAQSLLQAIEMRERVNADSVRIETAGPQGEGHRPFGRGREMYVAYRVEVPSGLELVLRTESGNVTVDNVDGRITVASTNGNLAATDLTGSLTSQMVNGNVRAAFSEVRGDVAITTVNGNILAEIPADTNAEMDARAINGGVSLHEQIAIAGGERDPRHIAGRLKEGGPRLTLQTTNGGVRVAPIGAAPGGRSLRGRRGSP